jgi:hypothetical protein
VNKKTQLPPGAQPCSTEILSEILVSKLSKSPKLAAKQARLLALLKSGAKLPDEVASSPRARSKKAP